MLFRSIIVIQAVIVALDGAGNFHGPLAVGGIFHRTLEAVGFVIWRGAEVAVEPHGAIAMVMVNRTLRAIHGQRIVIRAEPVAVSVGIRNKPPLQHFVGRKAHARSDVAGFESGLFHLGEIILRVAVQNEFADFDERIVLVRPDFRQIKRIEVVSARLRMIWSAFSAGP